MSNLERIVRLRAGESTIVLSMGLLLLLNAIARQVSSIVGISGFLNSGSVDGILIVLAVDYFIILLMTGVQSLLIDRFDHITILRAMSFGFALVFALVLVFFSFDLDIPPRFNYALLYIIAEQQWLVFPLVFWVLANDVFSMAQAKRLFPLMASFGFAGKLLGSVLTGISPSLSQRLGVTQVGILGINVLIYFLALVILIVGFRNVHIRKRTPRSETVRQTVSEGWGFVREVPAFRYVDSTTKCNFEGRKERRAAVG